MTFFNGRMDERTNGPTDGRTDVFRIEMRSRIVKLMATTFVHDNSQRLRMLLRAARPWLPWYKKRYFKWKNLPKMVRNKASQSRIKPGYVSLVRQHQFIRDRSALILINDHAWPLELKIADIFASNPYESNDTDFNGVCYPSFSPLVINH